jgi:hypothetical protein
MSSIYGPNTGFSRVSRTSKMNSSFHLKKTLEEPEKDSKSLSQEFGHDPLLFNPRQLLVKSLKFIGESFMVDSHAMENGCI